MFLQDRFSLSFLMKSLRYLIWFFSQPVSNCTLRRSWNNLIQKTDIFQLNFIDRAVFLWKEEFIWKYWRFLNKSMRNNASSWTIVPFTCMKTYRLLFQSFHIWEKKMTENCSNYCCFSKEFICSKTINQFSSNSSWWSHTKTTRSSKISLMKFWKTNFLIFKF